jgi:hypothetical protein
MRARLATISKRDAADRHEGLAERDRRTATWVCAAARSGVAPSWDAEAKTLYGYASYRRLLCHDGIRGAAAKTAATTRSRGEGGDTVYFLTVSRTVSFMLPTAFCILPAAFSAFPSAFVFWSPKTFPTTSLTLPTTCLTDT